MPWKETSPMDQKMQFIADYLRKTRTMSELCSHCGISRKTGYKWRNPLESRMGQRLPDLHRRVRRLGRNRRRRAERLLRPPHARPTTRALYGLPIFPTGHAVPRDTAYKIPPTRRLHQARTERQPRTLATAIALPLTRLWQLEWQRCLRDWASCRRCETAAPQRLLRRGLRRKR